MEGVICMRGFFFLRMNDGPNEWTLVREFDSITTAMQRLTQVDLGFMTRFNFPRLRISHGFMLHLFLSVYLTAIVEDFEPSGG